MIVSFQCFCSFTELTHIMFFHLSTNEARYCFTSKWSSRVKKNMYNNV